LSVRERELEGNFFIYRRGVGNKAKLSFAGESIRSSLLTLRLRKSCSGCSWRNEVPHIATLRVYSNATGFSHMDGLSHDLKDLGTFSSLRDHYGSRDIDNTFSLLSSPYGCSLLPI